MNVHGRKQYHQLYGLCFIMQQSVGHTVNNGSVPSTDTSDMNHSSVRASCLHNSMHLDSDSSAPEDFEGSETTLTGIKAEEKPCLRQE